LKKAHFQLYDTSGVKGLSTKLAIQNQNTITSSQMFTKSMIDSFIDSRPSGINSQTIVNYHYALNKLVGHPISPEGINAYLNSLTCGNGKHNYYRCIKTLCRWLYRTDQLPNNPVDKVLPPRRQRKLLPAVSKDQLEVLMKHCRCERDRALINLLWYSGMRISEAINIKAGDFNHTEGTVIVLGKGNKFRRCLSGNGAVKAWFTEHDIFGLCRRGAQSMLQRLESETGIKCNAHSYRRGFCVHQVKSGLSTRIVQSLGGWEDITMVERYSKSLTFDEALRLYSNIPKV